MKHNDYPEFWSKCCHARYNINLNHNPKSLYICRECGAECEVEHAYTDKDILAKRGVIKY